MGHISAKDYIPARLSNTNMLSPLDEYIEKNWSYIASLAQRLTGNYDDAQDLMQETWVKVCTAFDRYDSRHEFKHWVTRIMENAWIDLYRRGRRNSEVVHFDGVLMGDGEHGSILEVMADPYRMEDNLEYEISIRAPVKDALQRLPAERRELFILFYFDGRSYEEIEEITGVCVGTVKSRLNRGRKDMRKYLAEMIREE